jgi:hypothetical protein
MEKIKIKIRFLIPIFLVSKESDKYIITEKSFKYYCYLKNLFIDEIIMDFTIIGSEKNFSKDLTLKYFSEDSYIEFDQGEVNYLNRIDLHTLNTIVGQKISYGYNNAKKYNPDLIIFIKSNHFISEEWLKYIINDFNKESNIFYGMALENNKFIMTLLNKDYNIDTENNTFIIDNTDKQPTRNIDACLLAIPKNLYINHEMDPNCLTEIQIRDQLIQLGGKINLQYENHHIFNIKSNSINENVTDLNDILKIFNIDKNTDKSKIEIQEKIFRDILLINSL